MDLFLARPMMHAFRAKSRIVTLDVNPTPWKADALRVWPSPTCVQELRTALGTFGIWWQYVHVYADITAPLTLLLKKGVVWRWRKDIDQASFDGHKKCYSSCSCVDAH